MAYRRKGGGETGRKRERERRKRKGRREGKRGEGGSKDERTYHILLCVHSAHSLLVSPPVLLLPWQPP